MKLATAKITASLTKMLQSVNGVDKILGTHLGIMLFNSKATQIIVSENYHKAESTPL